MTRKSRLFLKYSLLYIICFTVIFVPHFLRRSSLIATGDCYNQFFPTLNYLSDYYRKLLFGKASLFDTSIGFGDDVIGTLSYYGLGDIFLIPAMFFKQTMMPYVYSAIVMIKMWMAGLFFIIYCRYKNCSDELLIAAGIAYGLCFYMLQNGLSAFGFLTAPVLFPLLFLGMDRIYDGKEKSGFVLLTIVVFVQALNGFYFLYYDVIACVSYCLIKTFIGRDGIRKSSAFIISDLKIAGAFFAGICFSSFILFPVLKHYFQSKRTQEVGNIILKLIKIPSFQDIVVRLRNLIVPSYGLYEYGFGLPIVLILISVWVLLRIRKIEYRNYAIAIIVVLFGYFFPAIGTIMNGFSYNTSRWMYIAFFIIVYTMTKFLPVMAKDTDKTEIIVDVIILVMALTIQLISGAGERWQVVTRVLIFSVFAAIVVFVRYKQNLKFLTWAMIVGTTGVGFMFFAPMKVGGEGTSYSFVTFSQIRSDVYGSMIYGLSLEEESSESTDYYRMDYNDSALDAPGFMGINSTYSYYSICNGSILDLFVELRVSPAFNGAFEINGLDNRQVLESIFSTKIYSKSYYDKEVLTNEYYLPQGLFYDKAVSASDIENLNYLERMNILMDAVIVDGDVSSDVDVSSDSLSLGACEEICFDVDSCDGATILDNKIHAEKGATITLKFDPVILEEPYNELYMQIDDLRSDTTLWSDIILAGRKIRTRPVSEETYMNGNYDYLVNISSIAKDGEITLSFVQGGDFSFDGIKLIVNRIDDFEVLYQTRCDNTMNVTYRDNDTIVGEIGVDRDGYLLINLPYSKNWKCYCDDKEAVIVKADYSFMAVFIPTGNHDIRFVYEY